MCTKLASYVRSNRGRFVAPLAALAVVASATGARADGVPTADWAAIATTASGQLQASIVPMLPVLAGILIFFLSIAAAKALVSKFARAK